MTCIVGLIDGDKMLMGADSMASEGGFAHNVRLDRKVFSKGKILFGGTGSYRGTQILRYHLKIPVDTYKNSGMSYMVKCLVPAIRECFKEHALMEITNSKEEGDGSYLVAYKGKLYCIYHDFQVAEISDPFYACGSGRSLALGALSALDSTLPAKNRIRRAIGIAEKYVSTVKCPVIIKEVLWKVG